MEIPGWTWTKEKPYITLMGHKNNIPCVAFDKSGMYLASGSLDRNVRLWDCKTGECLRHIHAPDAYVFTRKLMVVFGLSNLSTRRISRDISAVQMVH